MLLENFCGCRLLRSSEVVGMQNVCAKLARELLRHYKPFLAWFHAVTKVLGVVAIALLGAYLQAWVKRVPTSLYGFAHTMQRKSDFILNLILKKWPLQLHAIHDHIWFFCSDCSCFYFGNWLDRPFMKVNQKIRFHMIFFVPFTIQKRAFNQIGKVFLFYFLQHFKLHAKSDFSDNLIFPVQTSCFS